jgi:methyl-accepting chemotaxis protein
MTVFYNLKIAHKLLLGFGLCLAFAVLTGVVAVTRMAQINAAAEMLNVDTVEGLGLLENFSGPMRQFRTTEYRAVLNNDPQTYPKDETRLTKLRQATVQPLADYAATVQYPEDRANITALTALWNQYQVIHDEQLVPALKRGDAKQSKVLINQTMRDVALRLFDQIDAMVAWNESQGVRHSAEIKATYLAARTLIIVLLALSVLFGSLAAWLITRYMTQALAEVSQRITSMETICIANLSNAVAALEQGDLTVKIATGTEPMTNQAKDEFGQMARTFNRMLTKLQGTIGSFRMSQASLSNLIQDMQQSAAQVDSAAQTLSGTSQQIGAATEEIGATMHEVAQASEQSARGASEIAQGSASQAASIATGAAQVKELTRIVRNIAQESEATNQAADHARQTITSGTLVIEETVAGMQRIQDAVSQSAQVIHSLGETSAKIGGIVQTIDEIAGQTNLLALNAAIEAARAGEAGRGFAVVADEVRKLAGRCTSATKDIGTLISSIQHQTDQAVTAMETGTQEVTAGIALAQEARAALERMKTVSYGMGVRITEITAASQGMSASAQEVSATISEVAAVIEESSAAAEEMSASAEEVSASVQTVAGTTSQQGAAVEELVASASELAGVSQSLSELISRFKIDAAQPAGQSVKLSNAKPSNAKPTLTLRKVA